MIKISKQSDYAFQLIMALAKLDKNSLLSLKSFSNKSNISFLFLQKIARALREAGIIESAQGKNGGYRLSRGVGNISIKEVMEAVEGPYGAVECVRANGYCHKMSNCSIKNSISKINQQMIKMLETMKVSSIVENN